LNELGLPREDKDVETPVITKHPVQDARKVQLVYAKRTATDYASEKRLTNRQLSYRPKLPMSRSRDFPKVQEIYFPSINTDKSVKRILAIGKLPLQSKFSIHRHKSSAIVKQDADGDLVITYVSSASLVDRLATTATNRNARRRRTIRAQHRANDVAEAIRRKEAAQSHFLASTQERAQGTPPACRLIKSGKTGAARRWIRTPSGLLIRTYVYSASIASRLATMAGIWDTRRRRAMRAYLRAINIRDALRRKQSAQLRFLTLVKKRAKWAPRIKKHKERAKQAPRIKKHKERAKRAPRTKKHIAAILRKVSVPAGIRARTVVPKSYQENWSRTRMQRAARRREAFATRIRKITVPPPRRRTNPFIFDKSYMEDWTEEDRQYSALSAEARRAQLARRREVFTRRLAARELERERERQVLADIAELPWDEGDLGGLVGGGGGGASRGAERQVDIESIFEELMNFDKDKGKRDR